jgi:nucleoside-diphosphate-sugar epimerase
MLRASFFAQNLCGPYRADIRDDDRIFVPAGGESVSWVDTRDLGEAAARAFLDPAAKGQAWTLTGGEARTFEEVASLLTEHLGRPIRYQPASLAGYLWHLRRHRHLPLAQAVVYAVLHTAIRFGAERRVDPTLQAVLGRTPRTIDDTIRDHLDLWRR